jgi:hypothetical protein
MMAQAPGRQMRPEEAVQAIVRLLDQSRAATHFSTFDHFTRALAIWEGALMQVKMREWLSRCQGMEKGMGPLAEALAMLIAQAADNYQDILGSVYMALSANHKWMGQYFTPYPVASMMAQMLLADLVLPTPDGRPIRFHEPCIGSGVLFLAAAEVIEQRYPGAIACGEVEFSGQDLDPCCVRMASLNLRLHGIGRGSLITPTVENARQGQGIGSIDLDSPLLQLLLAPQCFKEGDGAQPERAPALLAEDEPEGSSPARERSERLPVEKPSARRRAKRAALQIALFP